MKSSQTKTIIVAIDFSDYSKIVAKEGRLLAKRLKVKAIFVHVFQEASLLDSKFKLERAGYLQDIEALARKKYELGRRDAVIICEGKAHEQIIKIASQVRSPLIMVGHRGRNPVARLFIGSTAEKLALESPFPLWIHRGTKAVLPKKILAPFDFSDRTDRSIAQLSALNKSLSCKLEMYHVMQEPFPALDFQAYSVIYEEVKRADDEGMKAFKERNPKLKTKRDKGWVVECIQYHSRSFDLVALVPRKDKNLEYFGSVTTKLIRSGTKPVLVLR